MYAEQVTPAHGTSLAVVLSVFLLISSGFVPVMSAGNGTVANSLGNDFMNLLAALDPTTVTVTHQALGSGIPPFQQQTPIVTAETETPAAVPTEGAGLLYSSTSSTIVSIAAILPGIWDESSKKRSRSQIYVEILELLKRGPMTPFEIAFYARLNHKRCKEYVRLLEREGYVHRNEEDGRSLFGLTENGKEIIEKVRRIFEKSGFSATPTPRSNSN
jgi:predicted transcriptional regulator